MGEALHTSKPNEVLHFDFLYMGMAKTADQYILLMKDDLSGYIWLHLTAASNATEAVEILMLGLSTFCIVHTWFSYQGDYFKNEVMPGLP